LGEGTRDIALNHPCKYGNQLDDIQG
jgi:hypothetical protein